MFLQREIMTNLIKFLYKKSQISKTSLNFKINSYLDIDLGPTVLLNSYFIFYNKFKLSYIDLLFINFIK